MLFALLAAVLLAVPQSVHADEAGGDAESSSLSSHVVSGVSPRGTTINLFDYWIRTETGRDDYDWGNSTYYAAEVNSGINQNHALKFGKGTEKVGEVAAFNQWTGKDDASNSSPYFGIVLPLLGENGYPTLSQAVTGASESLSYLFNSSTGEYKTVHIDVDGLLQIDQDGYYYYNSQKNFAEYDATTNSFILYDTWGVAHAGSSPDGQFFPFNTGSQVLNDDGTPNTSITSTNQVINHYFGMTMSTRFVQQYGGYTDNPSSNNNAKQVTYNFSGDDDVWIYIDNVLVGDLGGIHNAASIEINFATGSVVIYKDANNNNQYDTGIDTPYQETTLKDLFKAALGDDFDESAFNGNTFSDDTYHTLDFFYLERGNTDSNLSLKYNLVNIPESGILKINQDGETIEGVSFALYQADENYGYDADGLYYTGTTDTNGELVFTQSVNGNEMPVTLEQLADISEHWVLVETGTPEGYRNPGEMYLRFENGVLLSSNEWDTGAYSQPHVTATATDTVYEYGNVSEEGGYDASTGTMFAVVLQKQSDGTWAPVSGNAFSGWSIGASIGGDASAVTQSVIDAAQANPYQFLLGSGGAYEVDIENLPGDIGTYEYVLANNDGDASTAQYTVAYYRTTASSISGATPENTVRLQANATSGYVGFDRVFSVTLNISNVKNELTLEKTDSLTGAPVTDAVYALYADTDGDGAADSETPVNTMTTGDDGTLEVTTDGTVLAHGTYVLVETSAPEGYALDETPIQIVVDDDGVHVNAGTDDDNVSVETGLGTLVYSMRGFAAGDNVDGTLHDVKAQPQTSTSYGGGATSWTDIDGAAELHFQYDNTGDDLSYIPYVAEDGTASAATYTATAGWSRLNVSQCLNHPGTSSAKEELGDSQSLNSLFTGDVTIHVTDDPLGTLVVSKEVIGGTGAEDEAFSFTIALSDMDGAPLTGSFNAQLYDADGQPVGDPFTVANEDDPNTEQAEVNTFTLRDGQYIVISGLPADGAQFEIVENEYAGYEASHTVTERDGDNVRAVLSDDSVEDEGLSAEDAAENGTGNGILGAIRSLLNGDDANGSDGTDGEVVKAGANSDSFDAGMVTEDESGADGHTATGTVDADSLTVVAYTNTRTVSLTAEAALAVTKNLSGRELSGTDGDANNFGFTVTPVDTVSIDGETGEEAVVTTAAEAAEKIGLTADDEGNVESLAFSNSAAEVAVDADGDGVFDTASDTMHPLAGGVTFTGSDVGKTFTYEVAEVVPTGEDAPAGYTYDTASHTVAYTVGQNDDGTLYVSARVDDGDVFTIDLTAGAVPTVVFSNSYAPEEVTTDTDIDSETSLRVQKTISGIETEADFTFELTLTSDNADAVYVGSGDSEVPFEGMTVTVSDTFSENNGMTHIAAFDAITFTKADTYTFAVREVIDDPESPNGWTYDNDTSRTVIVTVEDADDDGELEIADVSYDNGNALTETDRAENGAAAFTNAYQAGDVTVGPETDDGIRVQKTLTGRAWAESDAFTFTLEAVTEGAPMPAESTVTIDAAAGTEAGTVVTGMFGDITYTKADLGNASQRTFEYQVAEDLPAGAEENDDGTYTLDGVTYDRHVSTVLVTVTDNGDGTMGAEVAYDNGEATTDFDKAVTSAAAFTNAYATDADASASVTLAGHKTLENGTLNAGDFHFVLDPETEDDSDGNFGFTSNDAEGDFSFTLSYDAASLGGAASKVFTYDAYEMLGGGTVNGIAYDGAHYTVEVTVTDNGDGTIGAEIAGIVRDDGTAVLPGDDGTYVLDFTNTYTGSDTTSVTFGLQKVMNGRDLAADDGFSFEVRTYSVETGLTGDVVASGNTQGMTAADGTAVAVETTRVGFDADDMAEADAAGRVTDNDDGTRTARFDFAIAEVVGDNLNVGYSDATYYATVLVRDDGNGNLSVESVAYYRDAALTDALGEGELPTFTNTYLPEATNFTLTGTKTTVAAEGATVPDGLSFSYDVYQVNADGSETYLTSATSPANGTFTATIPVDGAGTYTYRIAESRGGTVQGSVEYDGTVYYLVLSVTRDEATGVLQFSPAYYRGSVAEENRLADGEQVAFTNVYGGTDGATVQLSGTKTLSGDAALSDLAPFTFSVTDVTDAGNPQLVGNGVSSADGTIAFPTLTYTYYLQEQVAADDTADDGASDVAVETEGDGTSELADAENAAGGVQEDGGAGLDGSLGSEGAEAGGATDADADGSLTDDGAVADGSGTPTDGSDQAGATGEPEQAAPDPPGSSDAGADVVDDPSLPASAESSDAEGGSVADPEAEAENADAQTASLLDLFTASEAVADDAVSETISADVPSQADILDAVASGEAEGGADAGSVATEPDTVDDAAAVSEGASSDPEIVSDDLGDHRYVIAENIPADAIQNDDGTWTSSNGVTYDGTRYLVTVNVSAAYDAATQTASMTAAVTEILRSDSYGNFDNATTVGSIAFSNSYRASEPAAVSLTGTKTLSGRTMEEGEFSFEVYEGDTLVTTGTNAADGTIDFATFRVSEPGTHTYTVVETDGGEGGVVYDETAYQVTVEVTDNLDGTLSAEVVYPEGGIVFSNAYSTDGAVATADLTGTKTLSGRAMEAGEFRFTVTETVDDAPTVVAYGENEAAADGEAAPIDFTPIQYGEVGEHDYTVTELAGSADGVTYDTASFRVHVSVVDNGDGTLAANVSYPDGDVAFANAYEEPVEPGDANEPGTGEPDGGSGSGNGGDGTIPRTGDHGDLAGAAALALGGLGAAVLGGGALLRRRASRR